MTYLISITDVIEEISKGVWNVHELIDRIKALPSTELPEGDLISRQWLLEVYGDYIGDNGEPKYYVPLSVVRQNIKDAPSADTVSREFYEDAVKANIELIMENRELKEQIESADAVQGEWVYIDNYFRVATCSRCHKVTMFEKWGAHTKPFNYCPKCGAKMKGGDSE